MNSEGKTKADLVAENQRLVRRIGRLEKLARRHLQTEEELFQERSTLRIMIDTLPDCHIFVKDTESRFVTTNAFHLRSLGARTLDAVVGKTDFDFFPSPLARQYYEDEQAVMKSGQPLIDREEMMLDPQKREVWLLTSKIPLRDKQGAIVGIVGLSRDITSRKQHEMDRENLIRQIQDSLQNIKTLRGLIPICSSCKKIRDDEGYWHMVEEYVGKHSQAEFSHGICPECSKRLLDEMVRKK
jgi:PAS domain S-box-containing protein